MNIQSPRNAKSPWVDKVIVTPGNGGISKEFATFSVGVEDNDSLVELAQKEEIDLVVVGPEVPLCNGVVNALKAVGILAYGPDAAGARLEGKAYTKDFSRQIFRANCRLWKFFRRLNRLCSISKNVIYP